MTRRTFVGILVCGLLFLAKASGAEKPLDRLATGHKAKVACIAYSGDGKRLATGSEDKTVRIFDAASGKHLLTLDKLGRDVMSVALSPDGSRLAVGQSYLDKDEVVQSLMKVYDTATGKETGEFGKRS